MLKQKFVFDFSAKFLILVLTAVTGIFVARMAGPETVGTIGYATAYVSVFSFILGLFGPSHIKIVTSGTYPEADCNKTYLVLQLFSILIFTIVVLSVFSFQKIGLNRLFEVNEIELVILITLFTAIIGQIYIFIDVHFTASTKQVKANVPKILQSTVYNTLRIIVVSLGFGAVALSLSGLFSALLVLPLLFYLMKNQVLGSFRFVIFKKYIQIALPILSIVIIQSILTYADKLILENYASIETLGYYSAAFSIGSMFILIGQSAGTLFFPVFSKHIANNEWQAVAQKIKLFERFAYIFFLSLICTLSIFSHEIMIALLGVKYAPSAPLFSMLILASFFIIAGMPYGNVLSAMGLFWLSGKIYFIQFILFVSTLMLCIHPALLNLGATSLAITQIVINLILFIGFYLVVYKKTEIQNIRFQLSYFFFWIITSLLMYVYILPLLKNVPIITVTLIIVPVFFILSIFIQLLLGLATKNDLLKLFSLLNLNKSLIYIKTELREKH